MQDRVGSELPTEAEVKQLVDQVQAIQETLAKYTVTLTKDERAATVKMRIGGEGVVETIGTLAEQNNISLPGISVDGMKADLELARRLRPLAHAVEALDQRIGDTILEAQSECWWAATAFYTTLSRISGANAQLEAALKPVVAFFAVGRRRKKTS